MLLETIDPPGRYFRMRIMESCCKRHLEECHQKYNRIASVKFFLVPKAYIPIQDYYVIIFELKVCYKSNTEVFFVAETLLTNSRMDKYHTKYNKESKHCLVDSQTEVQYFINPDKPKDTTDDKMKSSIQQFRLSKPSKLSEYNLFKSRFF